MLIFKSYSNNTYQYEVKIRKCGCKIKVYFVYYFEICLIKVCEC